MFQVRRWTVLVVPHGSGTSRQVELSRRTLKVLSGVTAALFMGATILAYITISKSVDISRLERLERRNQVLAGELVRLERGLTLLTDTVAVITDRDQRVRLLAGLSPRDPDVLQAGIGGPSAPMTEADQVLTETSLGQQALGMRMNLAGLLRRASFLAGSFREAMDSLGNHVDRLNRTPSIAPTQGFVSSGFTSQRMHPIYHEVRPHYGIDLVAEIGTPIVAPASGVVKDVGTQIGYGKIVAISHGNGVVTRYAHCDKILVRPGQRVKRGDPVALVGGTGVVTNPHLHYEVLVNGRPVNPRNFIFPGEIIVD
jgi:murein DD-endopeptidase MepM/ murein hydrolase activator NlpD